MLFACLACLCPPPLPLAPRASNPQHVPAWPLIAPSPVLPPLADHEELAAAEAFNREMAELEDLEHQEELRSLLQDRISGERSGLLVFLSFLNFFRKNEQ